MLDADSSRKGQDAKVSNPPEMKKTSDPGRPALFKKMNP